MTAAIEDLLRRRKGGGVLVDTNILLLFSIGAYDPRLIATFKRTKQFTLDDFQVLIRLISWFGEITTTPQIMAEVNSLGGQLGHELRRRWRINVRQQLASFREVPISSQQAIVSPHFLDVGLTDCGIFECAREGLLVLTDDLSLYVLLQSHGIDSINFNHLRPIL